MIPVNFCVTARGPTHRISAVAFLWSIRTTCTKRKDTQVKDDLSTHFRNVPRKARNAPDDGSQSMIALKRQALESTANEDECGASL